jgi:hypothetical protein
MSTIVVTISNVAGSDVYTIKLNYVNVERRSIDNLTSIDVKLAEKPVAFTLDPTDGRLTVLGAAGAWTVWRLQLKHSSSKKVSGYLTEHLSIQLNGYRFQDDHLGNIAAVTPLSDSYVAMIAPRTTKKSGEVEHVVSVWDIKYGTLQAEQIIKMTEKNVFNKDNCVYNIAVLPNSHLAITVSSIAAKAATKNIKSAKKMADTNSVVMLCPYYSEPVSLMAAMGKMKQTVEFMGINSEISSEENVGYSRSGRETVSRDFAFRQEETSEDVYDKWVSRLDKYQKQETNALAKLMDDKITQEDFTTLFFEHASVKVVETDVEMKDTVIDDTIAGKTEEHRHTMTKWTNSKKLEMELSQFFISSVVSKCFQQQNDIKFWPVDVILFLMSRSLLRSNYSEKGIISSLLERKEWALIPIVLEKVQDIPENDLVNLIKALIVLHDDKDWKNGRFSTYLKMVVDAPRNDIFLQQSLKRINASELPIILDTTVNWLKDKSSNLNKRSNVSTRE